MHEMQLAGQASLIESILTNNKLILRQDSSYDLALLKYYQHGKWHYETETREIILTDESAHEHKLSFEIDTIDLYRMHISFKSRELRKIFKDSSYGAEAIDLQGNSNIGFSLVADRENFPDEKTDPYSKANNWWRIKPLQHETNAQVKARVLNYLSFMQNFFHDAYKHDREYASYQWFSSPLQISAHSAVLQLYSEIKRDWNQNFYDSVQAHQGFMLLKKCFSKKIKYKDTDNGYERCEDIMRQLKENMLNATGKE